ncbi:feruloyl esterase [Phialemonium atrogriseum]|uniref:Carboxylic ester hydrolase n=1 Tax=Phialemonium atrogriseum TaxID=1093897 RepID=A0AAJ0BQN1_9PEZI|nr:feruloyl esterase [Phialemonium atrogriseum]KAK1762481.1 feruloyl esterase [Phialemonium atrogriseum]
MSLLLSFLAVGLAFHPARASALPGTSVFCSNIPAPHVPGARVISVTSSVKRDYSVSKAPPTLNQDVTNLNVCEVNVILTHPGANDTVHVQTWLPLHGWNNRFVAIGGGAWVAGLGELDLALPASRGYAVSSTDAGLSGDPSTPAAWALKPDGMVNLDLLTNFASRSIHDMAVVGKAVTASVYAKHARHSFWNGCSTGGRQGLVAAQKYPDDFDGILAGSPAIYWTEYVIAELWPQVVMKEAGYYPSTCELDAVVQAAILACDGKDKVKDGVINDVSKCNFDPFTVVGSKVQCNGKEVVISRQVASIVRKIWDGPTTPSGKKLWYGMPVDSSLAFLSNSTVDDKGASVGFPFSVADTWIRYFVKANPAFDTTKIDTAGLTELFRESKQKFDSVIGSADPNLSGLKKSGGRLLVWHGLADQLIYPQDSVHYLEEVESAMGGRAVDDFFRLFLAPGVDHCGYGTTPGAVPTDPFGALVAWVENGTAPEELEAETLPGWPAHFTRKVCRYPMVAKYRGCGDSTVAKSYKCV